MTATSDFDPQRFLDAQAEAYPVALAEIKRGLKTSHWMWFIFPQLAGLGRSPTAVHFALPSLGAARAYLAHPVLGARLRDCVTALQDLVAGDAVAVFGMVDAMKLRSSLTLFVAAGGGPLFAAALARWGGGPDTATLQLLEGIG